MIATQFQLRALTHFGCANTGYFSQISWIDTGEEESHFTRISLVAFSRSWIVCAGGDLSFKSFLRAATFSSYSSVSWSLDGRTESVDSPRAPGSTILWVLVTGVLRLLFRYRCDSWSLRVACEAIRLHVKFCIVINNVTTYPINSFLHIFQGGVSVTKPPAYLIKLLPCRCRNNWLIKINTLPHKSWSVFSNKLTRFNRGWDSARKLLWKWYDHGIKLWWCTFLITGLL